MAAAAPAQAAGWLEAASVTAPAETISAPVVGSDAAGGVVAAWVRKDGTDYVMEAATRPPGGGFTVQELQRGAFMANAAVAVNKGGDVVVAWRRQATTSEIWAATRSAGAAFAPAQSIAAVPGKNAMDPAAAINDAGAVGVAWRLVNSDTDGKETIYAAFRPAGGSFSAAPISTSDSWNQNPRIVLDQTGRATVVWSFWNGADTNLARVRVRSGAGVLGTQRDLSASTPTGYPMFATLGLDRDGNAVAVWSHWNGATYDVQGAVRTAASDTWTTLPTFGTSASASFGDEPQVAVAPDGSAVAMWRAPDATVQAASRASGAGFATAQTGISAPNVSSPQVILDAQGTAIAVWRRTDADGTRIETASRPRGGAFGAVTTLSGLGASAPAASVDGLGNVLTAWVRDDAALPDAADSAVQARVFDASPPVLGAVSVPATATAGAATPMSAEAGDVWSAPTFAWTFGDGASGTGSGVSHAFGAPGAFTVGVTATDGAGNAATTTRGITVAAAPVVPPPVAATPRLPVTFARAWRKQGTRTIVRRLRVAGAPAGAVIRLACTGKGCVFQRKTVTVKNAEPVRLEGLFSLRKKITAGGRTRTQTIVARLRPGARVSVTVTAPGFGGVWLRALARSGKKLPAVSQGCLAPGSTKKAAC
ncbi:MAG: PKD domain-containing protein [Solirubrobacteraceae bacterium]